MTTTQYAFSNSSTQAPDQLASLAACLDPVTTGILADLPVRASHHCLEIGPGAGSVAAWLADRVGPSGLVVAVDLDTSQLTIDGEIEIYQHDIRTGLPVDGPFDLIHARLVLVHLPERAQIFQQLVDALAPGGWLVLGEFGADPLRVTTTPTTADAHLFEKVTDALMGILQDHGVDLAWADQIHTTMAHAGLGDIHTVEHAESWPGGSAGARLHHSNSLQMQDQLLAAGLTIEDLDAFRTLMDNPAFSARSYRFVCSRGRKPE